MRTVWTTVFVIILGYGLEKFYTINKATLLVLLVLGGFMKRYKERVSWISDNLTNSVLEQAAKKALRSILEKKYKAVELNGGQSDLKAVDDSGLEYYYELKSTRKEEYFGAASFTEWEKAFEEKERYFFVVAYYSEKTQEFEFTEYTYSEFMNFSTIPPFKVYFNLNTKSGVSLVSTKSKALRLTEKNFDTLDEIYKSIKERN